jgi:hypothetical protein
MPGLTRLPRTGGGSPITPAIPLLPILLAFLLLGFGVLLRKQAAFLH